MALTKANIAEHLYDEIGLNKRESKDVVESFFNELETPLWIEIEKILLNNDIF